MSSYPQGYPEPNMQNNNQMPAPYVQSPSYPEGQPQVGYQQQIPPNQPPYPMPPNPQMAVPAGYGGVPMQANNNQIPYFPGNNPYNNNGGPQFQNMNGGYDGAIFLDKDGKKLYHNLDTLEKIIDVLNESSVIVVKEVVRPLEVFTNIEFNNEYEVYDDKQVKVMHIKERTGLCARYCLGSIRGYKVHFRTADQSKELMEMNRDCFCSFCGVIGNNISKVNVVEPSFSRDLCTIQQGHCYCAPKFQIRSFDKSMPEMLIDSGCILHPMCLLSKSYKLKLDEGEIKIKKQFRTLQDAVKEAFSDASRFEVIIPDVIKRKGYKSDLIPILIATTIVLDYSYYESGTGDNRGIVGNQIF